MPDPISRSAGADREGQGPASPLFHDWHFDACAQFHETTIPASSLLDVFVREGATACGRLRAHRGLVSIPEPVALRGFSALWGLIIPDRVQTTHDGRVEVSTGAAIRQDITQPILQSSLGRFFPRGRVGPVRVDDLLRASPPSSGGGPSRDSAITRLVNALSIVGIRGELCSPGLWSPEGNCSNPIASLAVYLDVPVLRQMIEGRRFEHFDFRGILNGSHAELRNFPLADLPWPAGFSVRRGTADLQWVYDANSGTTRITLRNLDADVVSPEYLGPNPVHLQGTVILELTPQGDMKIDFKNVSFGGSLRGNVSGTVHFHFESFYRLPDVVESDLSLEQLQIFIPEGHPLILSRQVSLSGSLEGNVRLQYLRSRTTRPLFLDFHLSGDQTLTLRDMSLRVRRSEVEGHGGFHWNGNPLPFPNLEDFFLLVSGDGEVVRRGRSSMRLSGMALSITGQGSTQEGDRRTEIADLNLSANEFHAGPFSVVPRLSLRLTDHIIGNRRHMEAEGVARLSSPASQVDIGAAVTASTDFREFRWGVTLGDPIQAGPLRAQGSLQLTGNGDAWHLHTPHPLTILRGRRPVVRHVRLTGEGRGMTHDFLVRAENFVPEGEATLHLYSTGTRFPVLGDYSVKLGTVVRSSFLTISDVITRGGFSFPSWQHLLEEPRLNLHGNVSSLTQGGVSGPVTANYEGQLEFLPDQSLIRFLFDPHRSSINIGPLHLEGFSDTLEGHARLTGSLEISPAFQIGGRRLGIIDGTLQWRGRHRPFVSRLSLLADRFSGIRNGVLRARGDGFLGEFDIHPDQLGEFLETEEGPRHGFFALDHLDLTSEGFWRELRRVIP